MVRSDTAQDGVRYVRSARPFSSAGSLGQQPGMPGADSQGHLYFRKRKFLPVTVMGPLR